MDGVLVSYFNDSVPSTRKEKLAVLYNDKELMIQAALCFMAIFMRFREDEGFYVRGISESGVQPEGG